MTEENLWVLRTHFTIPAFQGVHEEWLCPRALPFPLLVPVALEEEHLTAFIVVIEENFELEACNDDSALKQAYKLTKKFEGSCGVSCLLGVFLLLEVLVGLKKAKSNTKLLSSSFKDPNKGKRQRGEVTTRCL